MSPLKRVRQCRRYAFDPDAGELPVTFRPLDDGGVDVGVGGLKTCGSWHSCLVCGGRVAVHRAEELAHMFRIWEALGNSVVLATFTCRHNRGQSLEQLVAGQRAGWEAVRSDRPWKADLAELGVAKLDRHEAERRELLALLATAESPAVAAELQRELRKLRETTGVIRAFEVTHGDEHGWHPHYHVFLLVEGKITPERARAAIAPMWDRWCAGLAEHGLSALAEVSGESAGFDVQVLGDGDSGSWARYPFKLALEAVGGVFKRGRSEDRDGRPVGRRHRTPAEVMEHLAVAQVERARDDPQALADRAIVEEWSRTASDMRFRQCPLPPGMRAWFAMKAAELGIEGPLLEAEQTDEEIAAAVVEGTQVGGSMPAGAWTSTVAYELDTLREAGRRLGLGGVVGWYDQRGIPLELSRTGEARLAEEQDRPPPGVVVAVWSGGRRVAVA